MATAPEYQLIESETDFHAYLDKIQDSKVIAFDTEFVSEDRYQPELCLLQVAAGPNVVIIDPLRIGHSLEPFWQLLTKKSHTTVAHAGREEFRFCHRFAKGRPNQFFDIQIAAGLVGLEYPAAYSTLVAKLAGKSLEKGETRTDWRRRPLSRAQLTYAALDVFYLEKIYKKISSRLDKMNRSQWLFEEMDQWQTEVESSINGSHQWRRLSGTSTLDRRSLAVVKQLWQWREQTAESRDLPARRILRDDLLIELAKRANASTQKIQAVRGMERRQYQRYLGEMSAAIKQALALPEKELPKRQFGGKTPQLGQLGQFLTAAMGIICRQNKVAPGIFGTTSELRQLAAWKLGMVGKPDSRLAEGWRGEMIMPMIDGLLSGKISMRVRNAKATEPLELFNLEDS